MKKKISSKSKIDFNTNWELTRLTHKSSFKMISTGPNNIPTLSARFIIADRRFSSIKYFWKWPWLVNVDCRGTFSTGSRTAWNSLKQHQRSFSRCLRFVNKNKCKFFAQQNHLLLKSKNPFVTFWQRNAHQKNNISNTRLQSKDLLWKLLLPSIYFIQMSIIKPTAHNK